MITRKFVFLFPLDIQVLFEIITALYMCPEHSFNSIAFSEYSTLYVYIDQQNHPAIE